MLSLLIFFFFFEENLKKKRRGRGGSQALENWAVGLERIIFYRGMDPGSGPDTYPFFDAGPLYILL